MIKKYLYFFGCVIGLLIIGVATALILIDIDRYKPKLENLLAQSTGIDWGIKGDIDLTVFPSLSLTINDIRATGKITEVLNIGHINIEMNLLPLFSRDIHIETVAINSPELRITKDAKGNLNIPIGFPTQSSQKTQADAELPIHSLIIKNLSIDRGSVIFFDNESDTETRLAPFDLMLGSFTIIENNSIIGDFANHIRKSMLSGKFQSKSLSVNNLLIEDISLRLSGNNGIFSIKPIKAKVHDGQVLGDLTIDTTSQMPATKLLCSSKGYRIDHIFHEVDQEEIIDGALDLSAQVNSRGITREQLTHNLNGNVSIRGDNLLFKKIDLDTILNEYEKSQNFSLFDLGGFFILGPFGPLLTKTYDYTNVYLETGKGDSTITQIVADWDIKDGIATAQDVAFATKENRIALQGKIDFAERQFDQLKVAIIDENGCERYSQTINGPFDSPEMEEASFVAKTIVNPVVRMFKKAQKVFKDEECRPYYSGQVPHPSIQ